MATNRFNGYQVSLHVLLAALAVMVVGLVQKNRELQSQLNPEVSKLAEGDTVEPVPVHDLAGGTELLNLAGSDKESLLFVFTTTCGACQENQKNWRSLYDRVHDRYEVVGISLDELEATLDFRDAHDLPFRVVVPEDPRAFGEAHKIYRVPFTVHVGRDGRVREAWLGVLSEDFLTRFAAAGPSAADSLEQG